MYCVEILRPLARREVGQRRAPEAEQRGEQRPRAVGDAPARRRSAPTSRSTDGRSPRGVRLRPMNHATSSTGATTTPNDLNIVMSERGAAESAEPTRPCFRRTQRVRPRREGTRPRRDRQRIVVDRRRLLTELGLQDARHSERDRGTLVAGEQSPSDEQRQDSRRARRARCSTSASLRSGAPSGPGDTCVQHGRGKVEDGRDSRPPRRCRWPRATAWPPPRRRSGHRPGWKSGRSPVTWLSWCSAAIRLFSCGL